MFESRFDIYQDEHRVYRWRIIGWLDQVLATSREGYTVKREAESALESAKFQMSTALRSSAPVEVVRTGAGN